MILDVDAGNTRLKWRLVAPDSGEIFAWGATESADPDFSEIKHQGVDRVRLSSVLGADRQDFLERRLESVFGHRPSVAVTQQACLGVINGYSEVSRLGVDRWLAMVAAYHACRKAVCVVDVGTTMTIDCVRRDGTHEGGYIVPGFTMMERAVYGETGRVQRQVDLGTSELRPGRVTESAVANGQLAMLSSMVRHALGWLTDLDGSTPALVITGGDAARILDHMPGETLYRRDLVLEGLALQDACADGML